MKASDNLIGCVKYWPTSKSPYTFTEGMGDITWIKTFQLKPTLLKKTDLKEGFRLIRFHAA